MEHNKQPLFADAQLVTRIERCEARFLAAIVSGCGSEAFALPLGSGYTLFSGVDSPFSKIAGLGFEPLTVSDLAKLEQRYHALGAPIQFELSTHAAPELTNLLVRRGYRFSGFEDVLGRALGPDLDALDTHGARDFVVRPAKASERDAWIEVMVSAAMQPAGDEEIAEHDSFDRAAMERAFHDMARCSEVQCWAALRGQTLAGGAAMSMRAGVVQLGGAATHPEQRRRGIQRALLAARLLAGRELGCDIAVVATQPGSQSQHNVQRCGFTMLYTRAVWQLHPSA